jgi:hypothetical protein
MFENSQSGFPAGYGRGCYVHAPGTNSKYQLIGSNVLGHSRGKGFTGNEELRKPVRPWSEPSASIDFELWRIEEEQTPPEGWPVGLIYGMDDEYSATARRQHLEVACGSSSVTFESFDDQIVPLLLSIGSDSGFLSSLPEAQ